jgi:hypothetical protein
MRDRKRRSEADILQGTDGPGPASGQNLRHDDKLSMGASVPFYRRPFGEFHLLSDRLLGFNRGTLEVATPAQQSDWKHNAPYLPDILMRRRRGAKLGDLIEPLELRRGVYPNLPNHIETLADFGLHLTSRSKRRSPSSTWKHLPPVAARTTAPTQGPNRLSLGDFSGLSWNPCATPSGRYIQRCVSQQRGRRMLRSRKRGLRREQVRKGVLSWRWEW